MEGNFDGYNHKKQRRVEKARKIGYFQQNVCFSLFIFTLYIINDIFFSSKCVFELVREVKIPVKKYWKERSLFSVKRVSESCSVVSDSLRPHGLQPTSLLCPWNSPGKIIGVNHHFLLQGIFPSQGLNRSLLHCRQILYLLGHQRSPFSLKTNQINK